ncbi:MAG TPA: DNA helicase RecQ [Planctomycetaceae bacterium]|nr:DNA helicase RecQ [Planctomycetaceae bacterium]
MESSAAHDQLARIIKQYWGYDDFLPLQREAMECVLRDQDSVVVLPTGGGKSLCYQVPALCKDGLALIVSPLISLMKDQVDALRLCGVAAACVNSSMTTDERREVADEIRAGRLKILYMSPERLLTEKTLEFLKQIRLSFVAIDEAHCISEWGHDFRPEYRELKSLRKLFPETAFHTYTATATEPVRDDIARQLELKNHKLLVGSFDRPNLVYRVERRSNRLAQIAEVIARYPNDSGIVYCIRRADVEEVSAQLNEAGYRSLPYHAGLSDYERKSSQEAFIQDRVQTIVATVAFGMGIDKSNVRYVIHAGMPKSLENYQQESGRAGRDGLEAECLLLYSGGDVVIWKKMLRELPEEAYQSAEVSLTALDRFASGTACRHRALVKYFGQTLSKDSCNACDVCLGESESVPDALIVSQKILSCVVRLQERFGADYTAKVLAGSREKRILEQGHDQLSTYGLLKEEGSATIRHWIEQLVSLEYLDRTGEYQTLTVTPSGREVLRGETTPRLTKHKTILPESSSKERAVADWEGVDKGLFEALRELRRTKAEEKNIPAYIVFGDATLRELAKYRPTTPERFLEIKGIGQQKSTDYGQEFLQAIREYCASHSLETDLEQKPVAPAVLQARPKPPNQSTVRAFELFRTGQSIAQVATALARAESTVYGYLSDFLNEEAITDPTPWVEAELTKQIEQAAGQTDGNRLRPIFDQLEGKATYEQIRIVMSCLRNREAEQSAISNEVNSEVSERTV